MAFYWLAARANRDWWDRRVGGFGRWLVVALCLGGAAWFLITLGEDAYNDIALSRHGVAVTAVVEDTAPYDKDTQYLLALTIDGHTEQQWTTDVPDLKVGQTVTMLVDQRDHGRMTSADVYGRRWGSFVIAAIGAAIFAALGVIFIRMDAYDFMSYARSRYGHRP